MNRLPRRPYLRRAHTCNYCLAVRGVTYRWGDKVRPRILWVRCACGRRHYACRPCARRIGDLWQGGARLIARCARALKYRRRKEKARMRRNARRDGGTPPHGPKGAN